MRIPTEAILEGNEVYVVNLENRTVEKKHITTGIGNWVYTEVLSGLTPGQTIVTSANLAGLADGLEVTIKPAQEKAQ